MGCLMLVAFSEFDLSINKLQNLLYFSFKLELIVVTVHSQKNSFTHLDFVSYYVRMKSNAKLESSVSKKQLVLQIN